MHTSVQCRITIMICASESFSMVEYLDKVLPKVFFGSNAFVIDRPTLTVGSTIFL